MEIPGLGEMRIFQESYKLSIWVEEWMAQMNSKIKDVFLLMTCFLGHPVDTEPLRSKVW